MNQTENNQAQANLQADPNSGVKGILLTITESGRISQQIMGNLNEAEFLGLGSYLSTVIIRDGIIALSNNQVSSLSALDQMTSAIELMQKNLVEGDESCGKESCSDCSPSEDSSQSSENSQE